MIVVVDNYMGYLVIEASAPGPTDNDILISDSRSRDNLSKLASLMEFGSKKTKPLIIINVKYI